MGMKTRVLAAALTVAGLAGLAMTDPVDILSVVNAQPTEATQFRCVLSGGRTLYRGDNPEVARERCMAYALYGTWFSPPTDVATYLEMNVAGDILRKVVLNGLCGVETPDNGIIWQGSQDVPADVTTVQIPAELLKPGTCFAVSAFDTSGNESEKSTPMCLVEAK